MTRVVMLFPLAMLAGCGTITDSSVVLPPSDALGYTAVPVQSMTERQFASVVRQRYDFSCGSAALATLLRFHYDRALDEEATFRGMWVAGDRAQIRKLGFSLLDMKRYLASLGLTADGFRVSLPEIAKADTPGIALIAVGTYRHFVVVKGVSDQEVLVGDPSTGLKTMSRAAFAAAWNGVYFVIEGGPNTEHPVFNRAAQWASYSRAPIGDRFLAPLSATDLSLTAPFYRDF